MFLKTPADRPFLEGAIRALPGIQSIRFVSKEEALQIVEKDPVLAKSLTLTGRNPFPESFDVRWDPAFLRADAVALAAQKISQLEGVDRVGYDRPRVARLNVLQRLFHQGRLVLQTVFWMTAFLLLVLLGRACFFPRGPFPAGPCLASVAAGMLGGAAGSALARQLTADLSWRAFGTGPALGLLAVLWWDAARDR